MARRGAPGFRPFNKGDTRMSLNAGFGRRSFLKSAGLTALAGVAAPGSVAAAAAGGLAPDNGKYDFDTIVNRFGSDSTKFDQQIRTYGKDAIQVGMGIADMDFKAAPAITNALKKRLEHEVWGYLDMGYATPQMTASVASWNKRRYGVDIDPATITLTTGVHPGLIAALQTFSPPGTRVLLVTPTYNGFFGDLRFTRTVAEESVMKRVDGRWTMDWEDFERRAAGTNTFILCNPQNPTGNCWSPEDLMRMGEICLKHRVVVLADEIHCDFVTKGQKYTPFASLPNKAVVDNSLTFKAASKSFGLAAHKWAWYYSTNPDLLARVRQNTRADLNSLGFYANLAAYTPEGEDWLNQCVEYIDGNHNFVEQFIRTNLPMITYRKPQGTYLAWLDLKVVADKIGSKRLADENNRTRKPGAQELTPEQMIERHLVKEAKIHLNQGASYGKGSDNFMRMNIATSRKLLELALNNLANAVRRT
jgi:cystathionine beta-lyase